MKIAQITHIYLPHIGGVEFYVKRVVDSLEKRGIPVDVLTTNMFTSEMGRKSEAKYFKTSFKFMRNPLSFGFIKFLRTQDYDIFHLHSVWFLHCLLAVFFRKKTRIISTVHGVYPDNLNVTLKTFLFLYRPFIKYVLNKSEVIFVYSRIEEEKLKRIFNIPPEKIEILPMAIHVEDYSEPPKDKMILFTGRIIPDKNPELLIKAGALLNSKFKDFKIVFVGGIEQDYKRALIELSKKNGVKNEIVFVKQLDPSIQEEKEALMNYYQKANLFVSLGSWEGQPTRLMEAMQFKTPVIAFSAGGTEDFVTDNVNGLVIKKLDEKLLAEKIEKILSDETLAKNLGTEARATIVKGYNWDKIFEKILAVYKNQDLHRKEFNK